MSYNGDLYDAFITGSRGKMLSATQPYSTYIRNMRELLRANEVAFGLHGLAPTVDLCYGMFSESWDRWHKS